MSAETLLGATGCASGSQMCSGTMPAFTPNPAKNSRKTAPCSAGRKLRCQQMEAGEIHAAGERAPAAGRRSSSMTVPACDMMRYTTAALRVSAFSCSKRHQAEGRNRHHFPGGQEEERVRRREDQGQAQQQGIVEKAERSQIARALHGTQILDRVHRHRQRQKRQGERKPGRQRIEPHGAGEERHQRQTPRWRWWAATGRGTQPPPAAGCPARQSRTPQPGRPPAVSTWRAPRGRLPGTPAVRTTRNAFGRAHQSCASRFISPIIWIAWFRFVWQKWRMMSSTSASTGFGRE